MLKKNGFILLVASIAAIILILFAAIWFFPGYTGKNSGSFSRDLPKFSSDEQIQEFLANHTGSSVENTPTEIPARTWIFAVDLSQLPPDQYVVKASSPKGGAASTSIFILNSGQRSPRQPDLNSTTSPETPAGTSSSAITINPISDQYPGDSLVITGTTTLPQDADIRIEIGSTSFTPGQALSPNQTREITGIAQSTLRTATGKDLRNFADVLHGSEHQNLADIVKSNGNSVYLIQGNSLKIVDGNPGASSGILSTVKFSGTPVALYATSDRLALISNFSATRDQWICTSATCDREGSLLEQTRIYIYSVIDPAHPQLLRTITIDGSYLDARIKDNNLNFLVRSPDLTVTSNLAIPELYDSDEGTRTLEVYSLDQGSNGYYYLTCGTLDLESDDPVGAKSFLMGTSTALLLTPTHLYFAAPSLAGTKNTGKTDILSFSLENGKVGYSGMASVNGTLINEYSLNEYQEKIRVVTDTSNPSPTAKADSTQYTTVYLFDTGLKLISTLDHIAPGTGFFSPRFMGNRIYLAPDDPTSPYTIIDVSGNPAIAGSISLPENEQFLYPVDTTHLLTIGRGMGTDASGGTSAGGIQLTFYDISDLSHPIEKNSIEFGGTGTYTPAFSDTQSFYYDANQSLLVLPVHLTGSLGTPDPSGSAASIWDGTYLISIDPKTGIAKAGAIQQNAGSLLRAYIDNGTIYSLSEGNLVLSRLDSPETPIKIISLT